MNDCVIEMLYDKCIFWIDEDLSSMNKTERMELYDEYRWMFSSGCKMPDLESLIIGVDPRVNTFRLKFRDWFFVVCNYSFNPYHFGQTSYSNFLNAPYWNGSKSKGNKVYPQRVILLLGMLGIFTGVKTNYLHIGDKTMDHGREYYVDVDKLKEWTSSCTEPNNEFSEPDLSSSIDETWVMVSSTDSDFNYSFLDREDEASKRSWNLYGDWFSMRQYETISSISVIHECYERAQQFIGSCTYKMLDAVKDKDRKKDLRGRYRNCQWLVNLYEGNVGCCKVDDKGGRFYSMMVGMGKEFRRNCLTMDGEMIVEVDVSSAQPTLLGLKVKRDIGITTEWLRHCLNGDFYEWMKKLTGVKVDRSVVKKYMMRYLFCCYGSNLSKTYEGEHIPPDGKTYIKGYKKFEQKLTSYLKDNETAVYDIIEHHKRHPSWSEKSWTDSWRKRRKGKWCSVLPIEMQRVEVDYIKACLAMLPADMKFYTIHDAICVRESDGVKVKEAMEQVSMEMYGVKISVKIENTSTDQVK